MKTKKLLFTRLLLARFLAAWLCDDDDDVVDDNDDDGE
jgi:hypothetical protein